MGSSWPNAHGQETIPPSHTPSLTLRRSQEQLRKWECAEQVPPFGSVARPARLVPLVEKAYLISKVGNIVRAGLEEHRRPSLKIGKEASPTPFLRRKDSHVPTLENPGGRSLNLFLYFESRLYCKVESLCRSVEPSE